MSSEIAKLRQSIRAEIEASRRGLQGFATVASHNSINKRMGHLGYILSILYDKFPHWACDMLKNDQPVIFTAILEEGIDYSSDLAWLKRIGLAYFDEMMERQKIIINFFQGVIIEGMQITNITFPENNNSQQGYFRVLVTLHNSVEMTLHFPNEWEPPTIV